MTLHILGIIGFFAGIFAGWKSHSGKPKVPQKSRLRVVPDEEPLVDEAISPAELKSLDRWFSRSS